MSGTVSYSLPIDDHNSSSSRTSDTSPWGDEEIRWKIVARTFGLAPAAILAGRLRDEGIPARAWQEGAGHAIRLTVGILGTGNVAISEDYVDDARLILEDTGEVEDDEVNVADGDDVN
jgi:hypothetical protein